MQFEALSIPPVVLPASVCLNAAPMNLNAFSVICSGEHPICWSYSFRRSAIEPCAPPIGEDGVATNADTKRRRSDLSNPPSHKSHSPSKEYSRSSLRTQDIAPEMSCAVAKASTAMMGIRRAWMTSPICDCSYSPTIRRTLSAEESSSFWTRNEPFCCHDGSSS